jgi:hypothetical protein
MSLEQLRGFVHEANRALALEIEYVPDAEKRRLQRDCLQKMVENLRGWRRAA